MRHFEQRYYVFALILAWHHFNSVYKPVVKQINSGGTVASTPFAVQIVRLYYNAGG